MVEMGLFTPFIFWNFVSADRYQVIGRNVHMDFVREHLRMKKKVNFEYYQEWPNNIELEILADTIHVQVR